MLLKELRQQVFETSLQLVKDGVVNGSSGNVSALDHLSGLIAITPTAIPYSQLTVEDIVVVDLYGKPVEGKWKSTSETPMHTIFYRERPDVGAVIHTHAPYASVFAACGQEIPMVLTEAAACLTGAVPVAPYRRPGSDELARVLVGALAPDGVCVMLQSHGLLSVGHDLNAAYGSTLAAEACARTTLWARSMGLEPGCVDSLEAAAIRRSYLAGYKPVALATG